MAYQVFWKIPEQLLCLQLEGDLSLDNFNEINNCITDLLGEENANRRLTLLIDITRPGRVPQAFARLKASQTYVARSDLKFILVVGTNKFLRLMMLLTFNLCKPGLMFFDKMDDALNFAQKAGSKVPM